MPKQVGEVKESSVPYRSAPVDVHAASREPAASLLRRSSVWLLVEGLTIGGVWLAGAINTISTHGWQTLAIANLVIAILALVLPITLGGLSSFAAQWVEEGRRNAVPLASVVLAMQLCIVAAGVGLFVLMSVNRGRITPLLGLALPVGLHSLVAIRALVLLHRLSAPPPIGLVAPPDVPRREKLFFQFEFEGLESKLKRQATRCSWICGSAMRTIIAGIVLPWTIYVTIAMLPHDYGMDACSIIMVTLATLLSLLCVRILWRGGCTLDRMRREVVRWRGVILHLFPTHIPFGEIQNIRLARGKWPGNRSDTWCHLSLVTGNKPVLVKCFDYRPEAQRIGQLVAEAIGVPFTDDTLTASGK